MEMMLLALNIRREAWRWAWSTRVVGHVMAEAQKWPETIAGHSPGRCGDQRLPRSRGVSRRPSGRDREDARVDRDLTTTTRRAREFAGRSEHGARDRGDQLRRQGRLCAPPAPTSRHQPRSDNSAAGEMVLRLISRPLACDCAKACRSPRAHRQASARTIATSTRELSGSGIIARAFARQRRRIGCSSGYREYLEVTTQMSQVSCACRSIRGSPAQSLQRCCAICRVPHWSRMRRSPRRCGPPVRSKAQTHYYGGRWWRLD